MTNKTQKVGYKSPPKATQWRKGQSGNPSGKKKVQEMSPQPFVVVASEQLRKPVELTQGGETMSVPLLTAFVMKLLREAMNAPLTQMLSTLSALEKLGVFAEHKATVEYEAIEAQAGDPPVFTAYDLKLLKIIQSGGDLDGLG